MMGVEFGKASRSLVHFEGSDINLIATCAFCIRA